jgi:putative membrane protein
MSSMSSVAGLSKYIKTLPSTGKSIIAICILSFLTGVIQFLINPQDSLSYNFFTEGFCTFMILGVSSILSGSVNQYWVRALKGINLKIKHSMFLSMLSMIFISLILIAGAILAQIFHIYLFVNSLLFACVLVYGFNTLVLWSTTKIGFSKSAIIGLIQPILVLTMLVLLMFLWSDPSVFSTPEIINIILKSVVACLIFVLTIYAFITILASPLKKNLGIGMLDLLSLFIMHMNEGSNDLESTFENMGESIDTVVTFICFKGVNGIKSLFISPSVHPGPLGKIGGSNMPTILANKFNHFTMVAHGPSTHDFNPISSKEIDKIEKCVKDGLNEVTFSSKASKFKRYSMNAANIGVQFFNEGMVILSTLAPNGSDDIEFGVGLTMMTQSISKCNVKDSVIVDCHNSFTPESGEVLPGNPEVFDLIDAIDKIEETEKHANIRVGCCEDKMETLDKHEGIGESGLKVMVIEVDNQRTAYVLFDSNNMEIGFRQEIMDATKDLDIDEIEVMTTDTHTVNTLSRGYNPVGIEKRPEIIEYIIKCIKIAIDDLEDVEVGTGTKKIKNLNTFGPKNSTELISTISSIVAVSKIIAPVLLLTALFIVFIWIFYGNLPIIGN